MNLGDTFEKRQREYRILFNKYFKKVLGEKIYNRFSKIYFHGSPMWNFVKEQVIKSYFKTLREKLKDSS